ncbi:hypothetical protein SAMN02745148_03730 [Modicisalibacter ilicicola DSM 19980]|uniref:Uncharacterized protein n=1 Tax=Modicisalibacter ilicicola DSM 19980 TaxID=1121942 RepID=A0A1M5F6V2_9GAMM|nr:hypothetical protein [Halomonas ilicicola]SHF87249.1 hypothetical protein SAMN02745148_03730 [Halomonas ilicicola DSM 19980]
MTYCIRTAFEGGKPTLQICDASSGSVRFAREPPREDSMPQEVDPDELALRREEAAHNLFRRLFLLTTEQYLKGEASGLGPHGGSKGRG